MKKLLYLDCGMGVAGDMMSAAFLDLLAEMRAEVPSAKSQVIQDLIGELNAIGIPKVTFEAENAVRCGILGLHLVVRVSGEEEAVDAHPHPHTSTHSQMHTHTNSHSHSHRTLADVLKIIERLKLPKEVRLQVISIYQTLAEAESHAHGMEVSEIHFHEVGLMDAIADITASAYLLNLIHPDQVIASPVRTGFGEVHSAHGILPVPAPATAFLLRGIPTYAGDIPGEMSTPTGAALLRTFVSSFEEQPVMVSKAEGYGMGKKDFPRANCVRAVLSEGEDLWNADDRKEDQIIRLECDMDDITGEEMGFAMDRIYEAGARDVFYQPVYMKKNRPGILLTVLTKEKEKEAVIRAIFCHTTTIGIREEVMRRYVLKRVLVTEDTSFGPVQKKVSNGYGVHREKWEYRDLQEIARREKISIREILTNLDGNPSKKKHFF
ncbi:MAG: nickel pincer cofactor biosynthesis protein LarC [Lachnospiraceae bacterium]|nr:nickel pincer cofactor biosynthesis protein LarC [Lachnospiraceae bacterium]